MILRENHVIYIYAFSHENFEGELNGVYDIPDIENADLKFIIEELKTIYGKHECFYYERIMNSVSSESAPLDSFEFLSIINDSRIENISFQILSEETFRDLEILDQREN